jgi:hypothetical protein
MPWREAARTLSLSKVSMTLMVSAAYNGVKRLAPNSKGFGSIAAISRAALRHRMATNAAES